MNDFTERQALRALRRDIQPARDLWPEIARRLPPPARRARPRWWPLALAASLLLALPLVWQRDVPQTGPETPAEAAQTEFAGVVREADAMVMQYRAALAELSAAPLPSDLRPLAHSLERDVDALRRALEAQPESVELLHQLRRTFDRRLRLGQRVALG